MAADTIVMQLAKKSGMRNRVKGLTEVEDGNISAEAGIQGPGPIVDRKNVEFYLYPTVSTALIYSVKPELTE